MKTTRVAFVIVSLITIVLLIGSAVLQRIVFKAAESSASVYLSPANFIIKPEGQVKINIISDFSTVAFVTAGQLVLEYDSDYLTFVESEVSSNFETKKIIIQDNRIYWAVVPSLNMGVVGEFSGAITIGQLVFKANNQGSTRISLIPEKTIISAIDPEGSSALYNTVVSVQDSVGEITVNTTADRVGESLQTEIITKSDFTSQQIINNQVIALADQSLHLIELNRLGLINIFYGETEDLGNVVKSSTIDTNQLLRIKGLDPDTKYFYQVTVLSPDSEYLFSGQIKTFNTRNTSDSLVVDSLRLIVQDSTPSKKTNILAVAIDSAGAIIYPSNIVFKVIGGQAVLEKSTTDNPEQAAVTLLTNIEQEVVVEASVDGQVLGAVTINFSPDREIQSSIASATVTNFSGSTQITLAALLLVILLTGLALVKLLRVK